MTTWKKLGHQQIKERVFAALKENVNYLEENVLGIPASYLDDKVFNQDTPFLKDAPFISSLVYNPNHIGCHTLGNSERYFKGTQELEREVIEICASSILKAEPGQTDGYVSAGGTEANMQAIWIYRNYFIQELKADINQICILCSSDSHYSMSKSANILNIAKAEVKVDEKTREISREKVKAAIEKAQAEGKKYFIVVSNMMTTMFGSVDESKAYTDVLTELDVPFKLHIDGAYGGFYYPFANSESDLNFQNPHISSVTLDAHKMVQAPYGTGIFLIRKGMIRYANTQDASYIKGQDSTISGSRSGANAVAIWMILMTYGPYGWTEKIFILQKRTDWLCELLDKKGIEYYREKYSNIVTIPNEYVSPEAATEFGLVPDNHENPAWQKIVVMDHVFIEKLLPLLEKL
ncbi:pyridoxal-dependent decarboxylase [Flammeovirgaceae bacterium SG7u.111]|nr:pyridoxal-dependent decarboxylase [Flammeovirgaceae bacterium SG7u.132]WPO33436.1 pyridoxal-dependent decarboxylase [Flammeovirgaceae bacterium SG7u.111]